MHQVVDELEIGGAGANREREREDRDQREARVLREHPHAELQIDGQAARPGESKHVAAGAAVLFDAAKSHRRQPVSLARIDALRDAALRIHLDVEAHLVVHVGVEPGRRAEAAPLGAQVGNQASHRQISCDVARSASAIASASRFQPLDSSRSRFRPSVVNV